MDLHNEFSTLEQTLMAKATARNVPLNGSIELLPLCNMNCDMCYVRLSKAEMECQGRLRTSDEWLQIAEQMIQSGVLYLLLTGGEPLLFPNFKELFIKLQELGFILTINTNGTLLDEEWADFFAKNKPRRINITLYGTDNSTYESLCHYPNGYTKVIHAIKLLKAHDIDVKLSGSLTRKNAKDLPALLDVQRQLETPVRVDTYMMPATRERTLPFAEQVRLEPEIAAKARIYALQNEMGADTFSQFALQKTFEVENMLPDDGPYHNKCYAGRSSFSINWQGELHPCVILSAPSANVFENGFHSAWDFVSAETQKIVMNAHCSKCQYRPLCRTCIACALVETGDYLGTPDYMCKYAKASYQELKSKLNELIR